ncbi:hypothetical protein L1987_48975 [Smallanthus sonchifolius]|uniref:Uncharacterized protein n=1 Tax=Smallanthus sonchifolius TaxID=185202 RepID=A0ACB9FTG8_9ASTR|nr:hypothetical protein L1987_48975 [Smallanthus sonchifolius]
MKCIVSLNSPELVKEFVLKEELWKECLLSAVVWEGQEIPFERVVKIRMEGLPIVLRDENSYRDIAGGDLGWRWDWFDGFGRRRNPPDGVPELRKMGFPITGNPETQGGGETSDHAGETEGRQTLHGEKNTAHVGGNSLCSPRTPRNKNTGPVVEMDQGGLPIKMGHEYGASSRKRPRCHRSPIHINLSNNYSMGGDGDIRILIPPFLDLNNPMNFYSGASDVPLSAETSQPNGIFGTDSGSVVPESQSAGNLGEADKEVAATIEVGNCAGIQVGDFANQLRMLINGEGGFEGLQ